jgi:hypothetical protein
MPNGRNTPRTWLPSARLARTNWSRDPNNALTRWLCSDFTFTALYQKPTMHPHCESFPFFLRQVGKFINLRIGPARHRID